MDLRLSAINLYPVKGIRGVAAARAAVEPAGLRHDRRWVVVDDRGTFLSQRSHRRLALITGTFDGTHLRLAAPGRPDLAVAVPDGRHRTAATVWRDQVDGAAADPAADRWLSGFLAQPCHLVYMDDRCRRPISSEAGQPGETVSFADGYPLLLISTASLDDLNGRLDHPLPMDRFRPNLVVTGCGPFAEDGWRRLAIGDVEFRFAGRCARCGVTTVDQATGEKAGSEPLRTLATYRRHDDGVVFGVNLIPVRTGDIANGAAVTILE